MMKNFWRRIGCFLDLRKHSIVVKRAGSERLFQVLAINMHRALNICGSSDFPPGSRDVIMRLKSDNVCKAAKLQ